MKARVVTVHLVIIEDEACSEGANRIDAADSVSAVLSEAEVNGLLLDWGYASGGTPESARVIDATGYEEGDFYARASLDKSAGEVQSRTEPPTARLIGPTDGPNDRSD